MTSQQTTNNFRQEILDRAGEGALVPLYFFRDPLGWPPQHCELEQRQNRQEQTNSTGQ